MPSLNIFISFLLVLTHLQDAYTLTCIGNTSFEIARSEIPSNNDILTTLQKLNNKVMYSYVNSSVCHVTIDIDYDQMNGTVIIEFNENTNHTGNYLGIETWLPGIKENDSIVSYIDYVCTSDNLCDQIFLDQWIYWLANIDHQSLQTKLNYLLTSNVQIDSCYVRKKLTNCSSGMCIAKYRAISNNTSLATDCVANASTLSGMLYVKIQSIEFQSIKYEALTYVCMSIECNSKSTFKRVWKEVANFFNRFKPIVNWLRLKNKSNESKDDSSQKLQKKIGVISNNHVTKNRNYSSKMLFWLALISSIVIVGIVIGYCRLRRRNSHEYTATSTIS